jgi:GTP-binding protein
VKAITSDKPGETKRMSFYQLTADVPVSNNNSAPPADGVLVEKDVVAADEKKEQQQQQQQYLKYSLVFVDLPGFGFAFAKEEKTKEWNELMHHYLLERRSLKRILLLLDARHGFKKADFEFLDMLQEGLMMKNQQEQNNSSQNEEEKSSGGGGGGGRQRKMKKRKRRELPPIQIVLTKCDLVKQLDLARRVVVVRQQLSDALAREPSSLPVMLVSARAGIGYNNIRGVEQQPMGGVLELQKELSSLVPVSKINGKKTK